MMKSSEMVVVLDTIDEAVKFYTEKLAFDIVDLHVSNDDQKMLNVARLRKGKCFIAFRTPLVEEAAEFTYIKRCASRCVCLKAEMKKGIEKYYERCQKKGVKFSAELKDCEDMGMRMFSVRDPYGIKFTVTQALPGNVGAAKDCCGVQLVAGQAPDALMDRLKAFGILRRFAKKFAKLKIKALSK